MRSEHSSKANQESQSNKNEAKVENEFGISVFILSVIDGWIIDVGGDCEVPLLIRGGVEVDIRTLRKLEL